MLKCSVKMKTQCFLISILYVAGVFNSFSNSQTYDDSTEIYDYFSTHPAISLGASKGSRTDNLERPKICQQSIISDINNRYASTVVTTTVTNPTNKEQEYIFSSHVPSNAFITTFVIEVNGKNYTSTVLEKEEANKQFKRVGSTKSSKPGEAAQVRNTQKFSIPINLKALTTATLYLSYEELLTRDHGRYEHIINIYPEQVVEDLHVEVFLKESSKIIDLKIPNIRSGNEIQNHDKELNPHAYISEDRQSGELKSVKILFLPKEEEQRKFARIMKTNENRGLAGQFVVQYDVENIGKFGEVIVSNGYFASFFAPKGLDPLVKHVIFVLDISGSMNGKRIKQLKVAMKQMLSQLRKNDLISLVEFNTIVQVWNLKSAMSVAYSTDGNLKDMKLPKPSLATPDNIKKATDCVERFPAAGGTDIFSALKAGLQLVELGKKFDQIERQPLIMFLTDGEPTVGEKSLERIKDQVTKSNRGVQRSPISTLAFGDSTNQDFLLHLAILNMGFFKHIYDADDSQLQISDFFNTISVPVLANVYFQYNFLNVSNTTLMDFPLCYDGLDLIVAGQYDDSQVFKQPVVEALNSQGPLKKPLLNVYNSTSKIARLWAFLTTKQLQHEIIINSNKNSKNYIKKLVDVCLKYSFVTPFSSMVVTTPTEKIVVGTTELTGQVNSKSGFIIEDNLKYLGRG